MRLSYRLSRGVVFFTMQVCCRLRAFGLHHVPPTGPVLLTANHQSFLDPMLVACAVPRECHFMARDTLFVHPYFGHLIRFFNAFPIKRGTADLTGVKETLRRLKSGGVVLTFPEGTRTQDGRIRPFLSGVITIARKARAPLVPCAVEGAFDAWPRGLRFPRPAPIWVAYGPPLAFEEIGRLGAAEASAEITRRVRTLHNDLRRRIGRTPFEYGPDVESGAPA
ncbi:MAG: 1-acyl-sn-glycerol-3-phosphate acyltransferase [bacterium]|nr:1-acyl-sn-glycerol-3-phosphate acyltransferase [bacterium]